MALLLAALRVYFFSGKEYDHEQHPRLTANNFALITDRTVFLKHYGCDSTWLSGRRKGGVGDWGEERKEGAGGDGTRERGRCVFTVC